MYKSYFGLRENPFNINPDPRFLYSTPQTNETLELLIYGIQNRKGLLLLTGEVGTGKTTLINYLLEWMHVQKMPTAFIFNPRLSPSHLFDFILSDFGIPVDFKLQNNMLLNLNQWLIDRFREGRTPVLIVDESQGLSFELLEEIRLLLNLETSSVKLLQILLVGQPELEAKLSRPELRQLRQRITLRCQTTPFSPEESAGYISERLHIAGAEGDSIFSAEAMEAVHFYSRGIPRVMNLICEHALIGAYAEQLNPVPAWIVEEAARSFLLGEPCPAPARSVSNNQLENTLAVMQSMLGGPSAPSSARAEEKLHEPFPLHSPHASSGFERELPPLPEEGLSTGTVPQCVVHDSPPEEMDTLISLDDLVPVESVAESIRSEPGHGWDANVSPAVSVTQLIAEVKRNLAAESPTARLHLMPPKTSIEASPAEKNNPEPAPVIRALRLETMNRISPYRRRTWLLTVLSSLEASRNSVTALFLAYVLAAQRSRVFLLAIREIKESTANFQLLLRGWIFEFKRDWISMLNTIAPGDAYKFLLGWLRQPASSKSISSRKNQPV